MNASEHIAQALIHLEAAANANYDHLLREQRHTEWNREVLASARASCSQRTPYRSPRGMGYANGIMDNS